MTNLDFLTAAVDLTGAIANDKLYGERERKKGKKGK
jgi:hypothetical protein